MTNPILTICNKTKFTVYINRPYLKTRSHWWTLLTQLVLQLEVEMELVGEHQLRRTSQPCSAAEVVVAAVALVGEVAKFRVPQRC